MAIGTVMFFDTKKGFGFIKPSEGAKDVFVHISELEKSGISSLSENQKVEYVLKEDKGKTAATDIKLVT